MNRGFTLIEVLMAVSVFAMIAVISYGALGLAGEGFLQLQSIRDTEEENHWMSRMLQRDCGMLSGSAMKNARPLRLRSDQRGAGAMDEIWMLVREPGKPGITEVHYHVDEVSGELLRESRLLWSAGEPQRMRLGTIRSFRVEVMDPDGHWQDRWNNEGTIRWPRALRIHIRDERDWETTWVLPTPWGLL